MRNNKKVIWVFLCRHALVLMNSHQSFWNSYPMVYFTPVSSLSGLQRIFLARFLHSDYLNGRNSEREASKSLNPPVNGVIFKMLDIGAFITAHEIIEQNLPGV